MKFAALQSIAGRFLPVLSCILAVGASPAILSAQSAVFAGARAGDPPAISGTSRAGEAEASATHPQDGSAASSVNFGSVNICPAGQTTPAPCSKTVTLTFKLASSATLAAPAVLTLGSPNLDFTLAAGSTCTGNLAAGASCTVKTTFAPLHAGLRVGAAQIVSTDGQVVSTASIYGIGTGPQVAYGDGSISVAGSDFYMPTRVALDGAGDLFVVESIISDITKIPAGGGTLTGFDIDLRYPTSVALDGAGNLFIADYGNSRVVEVFAGSTTERTIGTGWTDPSGVALDGAGNLFVVDAAGTSVVEVPAAGGPQIVLGSGLRSPRTVAVDTSGNLFVADYGNNRVVEIPAGGGKQFAVATGLRNPQGVAVDAAGDVFIADSGNDRVVEAPAGGGGLLILATDLNGPRGVTVDATGDVYIADTGNNRILKLSLSQPLPLSFESTLPGTASADSPRTIQVRSVGNAPLNLANVTYPEDFSKAEGALTPCTSASTILPGHTCDLAINFIPRFVGAVSEAITLSDNSLNGLASTQSIAVSGTGLGTTPVLTWHTPAAIPVGTPLGPVQLDATASVAGTFVYSPASGAVLPVGSSNLTVAFTPADRIHYSLASASVKLNVTPETVNIGSAGAATPYTFKLAGAVTLSSISVVTQGAKGLDFSNAGTGTCKAGSTYASGSSCTVKVTFTPKQVGLRMGAIQLIGTGGPLATKFISGIGAGPQVGFNPSPVNRIAPGLQEFGDYSLKGIAMDGSGDLFIADYTAGVVEVPAGGGQPIVIAPVVDGMGIDSAEGLAVDGAGNLFIADGDNNRILEVPSGGGAATAFNPEGLFEPSGLAVDAAGTLFIADRINNRVVKMPADGGPPSTIQPIVDGLPLDLPSGIALDIQDDLFIADTGNSRIVEVPADGPAKNFYQLSLYNEDFVEGIAVDQAGNLFFSNLNTGNIREIPRSGSSISLGGEFSGLKNFRPAGLAVDGAGNLLVVDTSSSQVLKAQRLQPPSPIFATTSVGSTSTDSPDTVQIQNIGNQPLTLSGLSYPADFPEASGDKSACTASISLAAGQRCDLPIDFTPKSTGTLSEKVTLTDNALNKSAATQTVTVKGSGTAAAVAHR